MIRFCVDVIIERILFKTQINLLLFDRCLMIAPNISTIKTFYYFIFFSMLHLLMQGLLDELDATLVFGGVHK